MKEKTTPENLTYEVPEAGAMLGLSRNASYAAAARGDIPVIKIGRLKKVPKAAWHRKLEMCDVVEGNGGRVKALDAISILK
jgi:hypothetical protein